MRLWVHHLFPDLPNLPENDLSTLLQQVPRQPLPDFIRVGSLRIPPVYQSPVRRRHDSAEPDIVASRDSQGPDRHAAAALQRPQHTPLRLDGSLRRWVVEGFSHALAQRAVLSDSDCQRALPDGREHHFRRDDGVRGVEAEAFEAGSGQHYRVGRALAHLAHPRIHVAPYADDLEIRPMIQKLSPPALTRCGHDGPLRQIFQCMAPFGDEHVGGIAAAGDGREIHPLRRLRRYVFQRVHGEVYLTRKEGFVELAGGDVSLVYDSERSVGKAVAGGPYNADLDPDSPGAQAGRA